jgi:hypothetical protein
MLKTYPGFFDVNGLAAALDCYDTSESSIETGITFE